MGAEKRALRARLSPILILCSLKIDVFLRFLGNLQICYLKIDVSCEVSVNFQHISQNATPATEPAPCRHFTQPRNMTRLKCCLGSFPILQFLSEHVILFEVGPKWPQSSKHVEKYCTLQAGDPMAQLVWRWSCQR